LCPFCIDDQTGENTDRYVQCALVLDSSAALLS